MVQPRPARQRTADVGPNRLVETIIRSKLIVRSGWRSLLAIPAAGPLDLRRGVRARWRRSPVRCDGFPFWRRLTMFSPINIVYNLRNVPSTNRNVLSLLTIQNLGGNIVFVHVAITYLITLAVMYLGTYMSPV